MNMTRPFDNFRFFNLLLVFFVITVFQKTNGYPYQWPSSLPLDDVKYRSKEDNPTEQDSIPSQLKSKQNVPEFLSETIHYSETSLTYNNDNDDFVKTSDLDPKTNEKNYDDQSGETDDENEEQNEATIKVTAEERTSQKNENDEKITQIIQQALNDGVFLTPLQWVQNQAGDQPFNVPRDEGMFVKNQKTRSPSGSSSVSRPGGHVYSSDDFIFPDHPLNNQSHDDVISKPVPSCGDTTFCTDVPYYPYKEVSEALEQRFLTPITEPDPAIGTRIGPVEEENGLCVSRTQTIEPKTGKDSSDKWRYIVNNGTYKQSVTIEVCETRESTACRIIGSTIESGYETSCKQKYIYRHMVALGDNGTESIPFQMPASCCCHIKFVGDPLTRMGINVNKNKQTPATSRKTK